MASDKGDHAAAFFVLFSLSRLAFPLCPIMLPVVLLALLGAGIELAQWTPLIGRDADFGDWVADLAGIGLASLADRFWAVRKSARTLAARN